MRGAMDIMHACDWSVCVCLHACLHVCMCVGTHIPLLPNYGVLGACVMGPLRCSHDPGKAFF